MGDGIVVGVSVRARLPRTDHFPVPNVPDEVVVRPRVVVEEVDEDLLVVNERAGDERVLEVRVGHRVAVNVQLFVDVQLGPFDIFRGSRGLAEDAQLEKAVVEVDASELGAAGVLLDLLDLDVLVGEPADLLLKGQLVRVQIVHLDETLAIILLGHSDRARGVVRNDHGDDGPLGDHGGLLEQVREDLLVVHEAHVRFYRRCVTLRVTVPDVARIFHGRCIILGVLRALIFVVLHSAACVADLVWLKIVEVLCKLILLFLYLQNRSTPLVLLPGSESNVDLAARVVVACFLALHYELLVLCEKININE